MSLPNVLFTGSVKNIRGEEGKSPYIFEYSDRYSVFDWGGMPDELEDKGKSLAYMAWMFFDILGDAQRWRSWELAPNLKEMFEGNEVLTDLRENGAIHHCISLVDDNGQEVKELTTNLAVQAVNVYRPPSETVDGVLKWDYSKYQEKLTSALVPLEVIFRFGVPAGSSLMKRVKDMDYVQSLGLEVAPKEGDRFDFPVVEWSTKLETTDRYITHKHAKDIAGLNDVEIKRLKDLVSIMAVRLKDIFAEVGVELWDGKFELAFADELDADGNRKFMFVDSIGPDELRLTYKGQQLSKENLRHCYRDSAWYEGVEKAKVLADERGEKDWKKICIEELNLTPPHLEKEVVEKFSQMYKGLANQIAEKFYGKGPFEGAWTMEEIYNKFQ
jgi:phosphoribosylaminoimidazole-succinocarboxamide synthase